jgi:hypothetical protein
VVEYMNLYVLMGGEAHMTYNMLTICDYDYVGPTYVRICELCCL